MSSELSAILDRRFKYGGRLDFWVKYHDVIKDVVKSSRIAPIGAEALPRSFAVMPGDPGNIFGGMRMPHFHLGDGIYAVDEKQWGQFTQRVMTDLSAKLANAKQVSFEQMMEVADAVQALP